VEAQPAAQQRHRARHDPQQQQQQQQQAAAPLDVTQFDWGKHYLGARPACPVAPLWLLPARALA
jgi:hypothetical protein